MSVPSKKSKPARKVAKFYDAGMQSERFEYDSKVVSVFNMADEDLFDTWRRRKITHITLVKTSIYGKDEGGTYSVHALMKAWGKDMH